VETLIAEITRSASPPKYPFSRHKRGNWRCPAALGFEIGAHALRATAATNALDHQADIAKVQEWLGHANIATTRIYDHRKTRPEDIPTFKVNY
jgi:integrase